MAQWQTSCNHDYRAASRFGVVYPGGVGRPPRPRRGRTGWQKNGWPLSWLAVIMMALSGVGHRPAAAPLSAKDTGQRRTPGAVG